MKMRSLEIIKLQLILCFIYKYNIHLEVLPFVTFTADNSSTTCLFLMIFVDVFRETTPVSM